MTSLVAWVGVDSRYPAALYIATDSRVTWPHHGGTYDHARKTFVARNSPDICGYVGDVLFPALLLPTVVELYDVNPRLDDLLIERQNRFFSIVCGSWNGLPQQERRDVVIVHGTRAGTGVDGEFGLQVLSYDRGAGWCQERLAMPTGSETLAILGSGSRVQRNSHLAWQSSDSANTSRSAFSAFCEGLRENLDPRSGGAPQLVGLYRQGNGRLFGVSWRDQNYVSGTHVSQGVAQDLDGIEWRDPLFQRTSPGHKLLPGAQRHSNRR